MATWERSTPWRQGAVLTTEATAALGLSDGHNPGEAVAAVISHDCDLPQGADVEPVVEVIVGRFVGESDGTYTHCKNLRRLHLPYSCGQQKRIVELEQWQRRSVPKEA